MKKQLAMLVALLLVIAVAVPAFAAVEFKYGGQMRVRVISNDNNLDGTDTTNDNQTFLDQRLRLYFTFQASENLKVVYKIEIGDTTWGRSGARNGPSSGGEPGADATNVETKNAYMEFNIPNTMVTADVGIQTITLLDSWIVDDDFAAAVLKANFDPFKVQLGYIAGQVSDGTLYSDRVDSYYLSAQYKLAPFDASLIGFFQDGHNTNMSVDASAMTTPMTFAVPSTTSTGLDEFGFPINTFDTFLYQAFDIPAGDATHIHDNNLVDLGLNLQYKQSWMSAYASFVKNLGSVDVVDLDDATRNRSADYQGFMVDAGANLFCGPYTFNLGGFYTTGDERTLDATLDHATVKHPDEINRFVYPASTQKYFSEIIGGGILDNNANIAHRNRAGAKDYQWEGYGWPSNIWTVTAGAAWQALEKTKISASYWYFGTSEDVLGKQDALGNNKLANDIGHELDLYITQGIVDGLTLDLVGAYLITGDAYTAATDKIDNAYEVGARLQWNF